MARPTVNVIIPIHLDNAPFAQKLQINNLWDTVPDSYYTSRSGSGRTYTAPKPGELRWHNGMCGRGAYERVYAQGPCYFMWMLNRSGGTLAQFSFASKPARLTANIVTTGTVNTIVGTLSGGGAFTADELRHTIGNVKDDAGGANAAPEGQWFYVVDNTITTLYFQPDMTVALAAADTFDIWYPYNLEASADGDEAMDCAGVIMSPDGIADDYWGWVGILGLFSVATANAIVAGDAVVADAGAVGASGADPVDLHVGWSPFDYQAAATQALIYINCMRQAFNAAA